MRDASLCRFEAKASIVAPSINPGPACRCTSIAKPMIGSVRLPR
jgi:hypothetical protein